MKAVHKARFKIESRKILKHASQKLSINNEFIEKSVNMDNNGKSKKDGSRMWKSSKKWVASSGAVVITLFGPANVAGAAEIVATELSKTDITSEVENKETEESSLINSAPTSDSSTSTSEDSSPEESKNEDTSESSIVADSSSIEKESNQEIVPVAASNLTLDMNPDTGTPEDSINYSLTNDGCGLAR